MTIRVVAAADDANALGIWRDADQVGVAAVRDGQSQPRLVLALDERACVTRSEIDEVVKRLSEHMAGAAFQLSVVDPVVRYLARIAGFTGGLRSPLQSPSGAQAPPIPPLPFDADALAGAVNALLDEPVARPLRPSGAWARLASIGESGNLASLRLAIRAVDGGSFTIVVPDRADVMPDVVALAADTARAVRQAFPSELGLLRNIAFDRSQAGFSRGRRRLGGVALQNLVETHLNAGYTYAEGILALRRHRVVHEPKQPPFRPSGRATYIDGVIAHELWHLIEGVFERRHYRESIEFRRQLGEFLGVPSLEYVLRPQTRDGGRGGAALLQLREQVSAYATTNPREATAELFEAWWWGTQPLPPVVARFGELVKEFFPSAGSATRGADDYSS